MTAESVITELKFGDAARNGAVETPAFAEVQAIHADYFKIFGKYPRLRHPRTFNEKIAWRKLYQRDARFTVFADKYAVKHEVERLVGRRYVTPTLWAGAPEALPLDRLTPPYVIKVNHSSGGNVFVRRNAAVDWPKLVAFLRRHLAFSHGAQWGEWCYLDIPRQVLVEPLIQMPDGRIPEDYRFYVYHGRVHFIQVECGRFTVRTRDMYDRDWRPLPFTLYYPRSALGVSRPARLEEMIALAETIGGGFDFVRIDLYAPPQGVLFGEATFYPAAGLKRFTPEDWDFTFGAPWKLPAPGCRCPQAGSALPNPAVFAIPRAPVSTGNSHAGCLSWESRSGAARPGPAEV
jgi:hypothetical protein